MKKMSDLTFFFFFGHQKSCMKNKIKFLITMATNFEVFYFFKFIYNKKKVAQNMRRGKVIF